MITIWQAILMTVLLVIICYWGIEVYGYGVTFFGTRYTTVYKPACSLFFEVTL